MGVIKAVPGVNREGAREDAGGGGASWPPRQALHPWFLHGEEDVTGVCGGGSHRSPVARVFHEVSEPQPLPLAPLTSGLGASAPRGCPVPCWTLSILGLDPLGRSALFSAPLCS